LPTVDAQLEHLLQHALTREFRTLDVLCRERNLARAFTFRQ
jgi:hypothetical protein